MKQYLSRRSVIVGIVMLGLVAGLSAQAGQNGQTITGFSDLLADVRGLRADLNQAAGASMRAQLLVARLSLQEQRIATLGKQLTDVQAQLLTAVHEHTDIEAQIKRFSEEAADGSFLSLPIEQRRDLESHIREMKASLLPQKQLAEQQLRTQESELAAVIAGEQSRWSDFNARLDEIERSLPAAKPR
jgi:hypothetical protein